MMQIDHDSDEPPRDTTGNWPYWAGAAAAAIMVSSYCLTRTPDWISVALGFGCGGIFTVIITAITGDRVPPWMRR